MITQDRILDQLRLLQPHLAARYHARRIALFGSAARGEQTATSDVDVLVDFDDKATLFDLTGLALFLEDQLGCPVDIVPRRALRPELREQVLSEAISI
jgi:predicted nucleotidyltransferase